MIMIEVNLSKSAEIPVALTISDRNKVKRVKLKINPITIPKGFLRDPKLPERTIGRIGRMHGERIVMTPAKKANARRIIMLYLMLAKSSSICPPFHFLISFPVESI